MKKTFMGKYLPVPLMNLEKATANNGTGWAYGQNVCSTRLHTLRYPSLRFFRYFVAEYFVQRR